MEKKRKYNCGNCNFFMIAGDGTGRGQCHKYVPRVIPTTTIDPNFGNILISETIWPQVAKDEWCGEWEASEEYRAELRKSIKPPTPPENVPW
jgi:hypothetical protein